MSKSNSRWRFMNPIEWLKSLYETFGAKHPTASLIVVMLLGAGLAAVLWQIGAQQYQKGQSVPAPVPPVVNTTTGPQSPIMPNNGGNITINGGNNAPQPPPPPKDKPK